jgi:hypothetical protein
MNDPFERSCPECKLGNVVERRNKKTGQPFWGCSRNPECKFAVASLERLQLMDAGPAEATSNTGEADLAAAVRELASAIRALASTWPALDERTTEGGATP